MELLFENRTTNGDSEPFATPTVLKGGFVNRSLHIKGNLDGGTFTLLLWDGVDFNEVIDSAIITIPDVVDYEFRADKVKGRLTGCGASCDVTARLI